MTKMVKSLAPAVRTDIRAGWWFHIALPLALAGMLVYELSREETLSQLGSVMSSSWSAEHPLWLLAAVALMPLNWWSEMKKWHRFVCRLEPMPQLRACKAVLAGVAVSLFTPNRVGEYGGRILFVRPENRWLAAAANVAGNIAQAAVLITFGSLGLVGLAGRLHFTEGKGTAVFSALALAGTAVVWVLYFHLPQAVALLCRWPLVKRIKRLVNVDSGAWAHFNRRELAELAAWGLLRYAIYSTQYFLLLQFFGVKTGILEGFAGISVLFLVQTGLPLPPLTGLLARGNLAVGLWSLFGANAADSLAATFSLWIINLILPAFFGTFFLFYVKTTKDSHV